MVAPRRGARVTTAPRCHAALRRRLPPAMRSACPLPCGPQDLSAWSLNKLRQWCRDQSLYAGGSREEVEGRISGALAVGAKLYVFFPARDCWRDGTVINILRQE